MFDVFPAEDIESELDTGRNLLEPLEALSKDVKAAVRLMDRAGVLDLVNTYYGLQKLRIQLGNQQAAREREDQEPQAVRKFYYDQLHELEKRMPPLLGNWARLQPGGEWAMQQKGIGPVICAGLTAHVDITRAHTAGAIWRFAGLDPSVKWNKGEKRPWNAKLKVLCWKASDSFVKVSGREGAFYGHLYREFKEAEVVRNEAGLNAECARQTLEEFNIKEPATLAAYKAGRLPDGRVDARARRKTVKLFLAHWFEAAYEEANDEQAPFPYILTREGGHVHEIRRPELVTGK